MAVALAGGVQRGQHDLNVSSALETQALRARHAVDAAVAWVRASGTQSIPKKRTIDGFQLEMVSIGANLEIRVSAEGYHRRELRRLR